MERIEWRGKGKNAKYSFKLPTKKDAKIFAGKGGTVIKITHKNGKRKVKRFKVI